MTPIKSIVKTDDCKTLFYPPTTLCLAAKKLRETKDYPTFLTSYSVDNENYCAANVDRALTTNSPMLEVAAEAYGDQQVITWLYAHLASLALSTSAKKGEELLVNQLTSLARTILYNYPKLRTTAFMLFCARFKAGHFGTFYGSFDPLTVTSALKDFTAWAQQQRWIAMEKQSRNG